MEINKETARTIIYDEIEKYRGCALECVKFQLYGMIDGFMKLGLITALQATTFERKIKAIQPWKGY